VINDDVMERENSNRSRIVGMRFTPEEYAAITKKWQASTCKKLSDYLRHCLLEKPIVTTYRNSSADDFILEMGKLRTELNAIGNNFNQAVKRLHTLKDVSQLRTMLAIFEVEKRTMFNKVEEIKNHVQKVSESWLR
jgi:hypothetical protein